MPRTAGGAHLGEGDLGRAGRCLWHARPMIASPVEAFQRPPVLRQPVTLKTHRHRYPRGGEGPI
jgi:hypothetical protein